LNRGIAYIIISGIAFLIVNLIVKVLSIGIPGSEDLQFQKYPIHELVLARSIISFALSFYALKRKGLPILGNNRKWLFVRGISGTFALTLFFYTIQNLPLAIASTVQYLAPVFTILFAVLLSGEIIKKHQWIFILSALTGVILISSPNFLSDNLAKINLNWLLIGVLSASFSGLAYSSIVKLKNTEDPLNVVLYFPMIAMPIMLVWCLFDFVMPTGFEWLLLIVMGVFTQIAQLFLTKGLMSEETSIIAPFQYLGAIYAALAGYLIFDESLSIIVYIGIVLILAGVVFNTISAKK